MRSSIFTRIGIVSLALGLGISGGAHAGKKKSECRVQQVFLQEVTLRTFKGGQKEGIQEEYLTKLESALSKAGFELVESGAGLGPDDIALDIEIRSWTSRSTTTKKVWQELAASVKVYDNGHRRLWSGEANPGGVSKLMHFQNTDPANVAKKTADALVRACRHQWQP